MITLTRVVDFIGIDPGSTKSGVAVVRDMGDGKPKISWVNIVVNEKVPFVVEEVTACLNIPPKTYGLAIEEVRSYGMAVGQTTFDTCVWSGAIFTGIWRRVEPAWSLWLGRKADVCTTICGSTRAKDANIRQAVIDRYGVPGTKKEPGGTYGVTADMWSAVALATTAAIYTHNITCRPESVKQGFHVL